MADVRQDLTRHMAYHHSEDDTLDKANPAKPAQVMAVWATLRHAIANSDVEFRATSGAPD